MEQEPGGVHRLRSAYPDCATTFASDTEIVDRPVRIYGGAPDDYNPILLCKDYVKRLKAAGRDVELTEYQTLRTASTIRLARNRLLHPRILKLSVIAGSGKSQ